MINCNDWPISVCTWSLGNDFEKIGVLRDQTGIGHLNLSLSPAIAGEKDYLARVRKEGWQISATMVDFPQEDYSTLEAIKATGGIVPEECWETNRKRVLMAIDMTSRMGVEYLMFHFGFIEETDAESDRKFHQRVEFLANTAARNRVKLLMETGQEAADELRGFLERLNHPALCVNFDPANMILYDKDNPNDAVRILAPWIRHIHVKDAIRTKQKGTWGQEVPWGTGQVDTEKFLETLKEVNFSGALAIEREAGDNRLGDIKGAIERLLAFAG